MRFEKVTEAKSSFAVFSPFEVGVRWSHRASNVDLHTLASTVDAHGARSGRETRSKVQSRPFDFDRCVFPQKRVAVRRG